jgi:hypothetical protein
VVSVLVKAKQLVEVIKVKRLDQEVALNQVLKVAKHRSASESPNVAFTTLLNVSTTR